MGKGSMRRAGGFTLMEMMIVVLILIVVISIVIPAIGGARMRAKQAITLTMLNGMSTASASYEMSERRLPGYFSPAEMGAQTNETRGFSTMENWILDVAGGVTGTNAGGAIQVGPDPARLVWVRLDQIGAPSQVKGVTQRGYWVPESKNFVPQPGQVGAAEHITFPDVVDAFGNPVIIWAQDDAPSVNTVFAAQNSTTTRAKFYWASNSAFLSSAKVGRSENDQRNTMIGSANPATIYTQTMAAMLGNPAYPKPNVTPAEPASARGRLVFHSAGPDGFFMGDRDRGGKQAGGFGNAVLYRAGQDVMDNFDDALTSMGN